MQTSQSSIKDKDQTRSCSLVERIKCQNGREKLDLSLCNLADVPLQDIRDNFQGTPHHLDLSKNFICYIGSQFINSVSHLTKLDLSSNNIKRLPDNFGVMKELTHLHLHENRLQTLPVSMSKMINLRYLSLAGNPLRPPLSDFLGYHSQGQGSGGITGAALAELVVQFMNDFVNVHTPEDCRSQGSRSTSTVSRRTPSIHYRGRAMRMRSGGDTSASSATSEDDLRVLDETNNNVLIDVPQMAREEVAQKSMPTWQRALIIIVIGIVVIPISLAYFVDSSYIDQLSEDYPSMGYFLEEYYKPIHELAETITDWIPKSDNFVLRGRPTLVENVKFWNWSSWFK